MICRTPLRRVTCAAILIFVFGGAQAADYFVSPAGNDAHNGNIDQPFRTVSQAVSVMKPGDTCFIREGRYHEQVVLDRLKGGSEAPYSFLAHEGEKVTFDGSRSVSGRVSRRGACRFGGRGFDERRKAGYDPLHGAWTHRRKGDPHAG